MCANSLCCSCIMDALCENKSQIDYFFVKLCMEDYLVGYYRRASEIKKAYNITMSVVLSFLLISSTFPLTTFAVIPTAEQIKFTETYNPDYYISPYEDRSQQQYQGFSAFQAQLFEVIFDANGGDIYSLTTTDTSRMTIELSEGQSLGESMVELPVAVRANFVFLGWFEGVDDGQEITLATVPTADVTFFARWQAETPAAVMHTVNFNSHGGNAVPARQVQDDSPLGALPVPVRAGHVFQGWFNQAQGGTQVTAATRVSSAMTLHARWTAILPTNLSIQNAQTNRVLLVGQARYLSATVMPSNALNRTVTWSSSDTRIATIDSSGRLRGLRPGTVVVTARTQAGNVSGQVTIRVQASPTGIASSVRNIRMRQGTTLSIPVVVRGATDTNVTVDWRTSRRAVATLVNNRDSGSLSIRQNANRNLTFRALRPGTARITLTAQNGRTLVFNITVQRNVERLQRVRISNLPSRNTMWVDARRNLGVRLNPTGATISGNVRWSSSNPRVASVDGSGRVTAHRRGEARITLRVGNFVHRETITVRAPRNDAADRSNRRAVTRTAGQIFRSPTTQSRVIGSFERRETIRTLRAFDSQGRWARVTHNGVTGFVRMQDVSLIERNTARNNRQLRVTLRSNTAHFPVASTAAASTGRFQARQTVMARAHNASGSWLTATVDGRTVFFRAGNATVNYHVRVANNQELNRQLERTLNRVVNPGMTRPQMKRALYNDTVRRMTWARRDMVRPSTTAWHEGHALRALRTNRGNCFYFAARFGFLARAIGYDARIVEGRIRARDGTTPPHGWVEIRLPQGVFVYDPSFENGTGINMFHMPRGRERLWYLR